MEYSVVIPIYNEEESVESLTAELREALDGRVDYEVIFVDDGSTDGTPARLEALQKLSGRIRRLRHRRRSGKSAALWSGVGAAKAPWIVTLDGDGQNDPRDILHLIEALESPDRPPRLELVAGRRRRREDTWLKRLSSRLANRVRSRILGDGVMDTACGLKLISREAYLSLPLFENMHRFLPALIQRRGGDVTSRDVSDRPRSGGTSKYGLHNRLWTGILDLLGVLWLERRAVTAEAEEVEAGSGVEISEETG